MKLQNSFLILFVLLMAACNKEPESSGPLVIDLESNISNIKKVRLSEIADDVCYIPLETNEQSLMGRVINIDISEKFIFLSTSDKCLLFDSNGKFILQIGRKGKGPGEYLYPGAVKIGENFLFVPASNDLLVYTKTGEFVKRIKNPAGFDNVPFNNNWSVLSDSLFICQIRNVMGDAENKAIIFDWNTDTVQLIPNYKKFHREKQSSRSEDGRAEFYFFENKLFYKEFTGDTLFKINEKNMLEPIYVFDLGKFKKPHHLQSLSVAEASKIVNNYIYINNLFETDNYFFLNYYFGEHYPFKKREYSQNSEIYLGIAPVLGIYDKQLGETFLVKSEFDDDVNPNGIFNDLDGGLSFFPDARINNSTLLMIFSPYELLSYANSDFFKNSSPKFPEKKKEIEQLAKKLDLNDNLVLMLVKLKE